MKTRPTIRAEAFYGILGEITHKLSAHSESDPAAILFALLTMAGCRIGRNAFFPVGTSNHFPKLFVAVVGSSARSRKSQAIGDAERIFRHVFPEWSEGAFCSGMATGQGLVHWVRDPVVSKRKNEETDEVEEIVIDPGVEDKRKIFVEEEFAQILSNMRTLEATLSAMIRKAWDDTVLATATKRDSETSTRSHVCILAAITPTELKEKLKTGEFFNGFVNRFLWCWAERSQSLPRPKPFNSKDYAAEFRFLESLFEAGKEPDLYKHFGDFDFDAEADAEWARIYDSFSAEDDSIAGELTVRRCSSSLATSDDLCLLRPLQGDKSGPS